MFITGRARARVTMFVTVAGALVLGACKRAEPGAAAKTDTAAGVIDAAPATVATTVAALITDENVFALLDTAYAALIQTDRLGQEKATDPRVRELAGHAVSQNALGRSGIKSTAEKLNVAPVLPDRDVIKDQATTMDTLRAKTGGDFDRAYLDRVIDTRKDLINEIDQAMNGNGIRQDAVRKFLNEIRANLQADRAAAEALKG
jgi:putative membrane protein